MAMEDYRINKENGLEFGLYSLGDHMPNALTDKRVSAKERIEYFLRILKNFQSYFTFLARKCGENCFYIIKQIHQHHP